MCSPALRLSPSHHVLGKQAPLQGPAMPPTPKERALPPLLVASSWTGSAHGELSILGIALVVAVAEHIQIISHGPWAMRPVPVAIPLCNATIHGLRCTDAYLGQTWAKQRRARGTRVPALRHYVALEACDCGALRCTARAATLSLSLSLSLIYHSFTHSSTDTSLLKHDVVHSIDSRRRNNLEAVVAVRGSA